MRRIILFVALAVSPTFAAAQAVQPGQWEIVTTVQSVEMPGAPPQVAAMMKGRPIRISQCISPADAAKGPQEMMKSSKQCRFTRYSMAGGRLSSEMVCDQDGGGAITATSTGTFTPTAFTATGRTVMTGAQGMTMTATTIGKRIGACK
jgi:hypothetical protein